jgi:hypothetical protein
MHINLNLPFPATERWHFATSKHHNTHNLELYVARDVFLVSLYTLIGMDLLYLQ